MSTRTTQRPKASRRVDRRRILRAGIVGGLGLLAAPMLNLGRSCLLADPPVEISHRAIDLVQESPVVDMLGLLTLDWSRLFDWHRRPERFTEADYRVLEASGIDVFHPAVETPGEDRRRSALLWITGWNQLLASRACFLERVDTITDLLRLPRTGQMGVIVGFQNSDHFDTVSDVREFHSLGQRISQLTYNESNGLGGGCYASRDRGLTPFGSEIIGEMNRVGMAVDVSHCGPRTSIEAIERSRSPVLITHSNCEALVPGHPRCKSDRVLSALGRDGGVVGITMVRAFVSWKRDPDFEDLLDHYDHAARVAGVEHVGIGSDVDVSARDPRTGRPNPFYTIRGVRPELRVFQIAEGLLGRGYSADDVKGILGGNFLRALASIWPDDSWRILHERDFRRDPFCPPQLPEGTL